MLSVPLSRPRATSGTTISDSGSGGRVRDEADARVELGAVREHGLAVLDRPAGDPDAVRERLVGEHLLRVVAGGVHGLQLALRLVRLVEGDVVVRDQLADRVGDPLEQVVERLLREQLVEDVRELAVRLDERVGRLVRGRARLPGRRGVRGRIHSLWETIGLPRLRLERRFRLPSEAGTLGHGRPDRRRHRRDRPLSRGAPLGGRGGGPPRRGRRGRSRLELRPARDARGRRSRAARVVGEHRGARRERAGRGAGRERAGATRCSAAPPTSTVSVVQGEPAAVLLAAAEGADLLVVGNRGRGSLAQALLGSTSARVSDRAQCPVVVVRMHGDGD